MAARKRPKVPRALIICCEGKTEEQYFNILLDFHRPPAYVEVAVYGQEGQHLALVDNTAAKRKELCAGDDGFVEDEIECWAVCDEDKMPCTYTDLKKYADGRCYLAWMMSGDTKGSIPFVSAGASALGR